VPSRRRRLKLHYELIGCALHGHALVGTDAAQIRPDDSALVRNWGGMRLHRCLRCDAWLALPEPRTATRPFPPTRAEIELPLRGRPLRDRYVLRLIAIDRAVHVVVLAVAALLLLLVASTSRPCAMTSPGSSPIWRATARPAISTGCSARCRRR